jgi:hypothetical protein
VLNIEPFPSNDIIVKRSGKAADALVDWIDRNLQPRLQATPQVGPDAARIADGNAAVVAPTPIGAEQSAGLYRFTYYAEVLVPDGVSSSLQLTITWTHNGKTLQRVYPAMTGDTIVTSQGIVDAVEIDGGSTVSYSLAYASNTPGSMHYQIAIALELLRVMS